MKRLLISGLLSLMLLPTMGRATDATWLNTGTITFPPQVDATNFVNTGTMQLSTSRPFDTSNTRNFTNNGTMLGSVGFRFDTVNTTTGLRTMADNFFNGPNGLVRAIDSTTVLLTPCAVAPVSPSYLWISATNIVGGGRTPASMIVGSDGELRLEGKNVDLTRSGLEVLPVWQSPFGTGTIIDTNQFIPDVGIFDQYWVQASYNQNYPLNSAILWQGGIIARSQGGIDSPPAQPFPPPQISIFGPFADSYVNNRGTIAVGITNFNGSISNVTEIITGTMNLVTNMTKGAVFVGANGNVTTGFTPSGIFNNNFETISVLISVSIPNAVTGRSEPAYLRFVDNLASTTNRGLSANIIGCPPSTSRPANYTLDRLGFAGGAPGNHGYPENNFFLTSGAMLNSTNVGFDAVTNAVVEGGDYAAYGALIDNVVSTPPLIPAGTYTNLPGRIRIFAENLDLSQTRMRAEGSIVIQTPNLISSSNAVIDCENLNFDLAATNGNLRIQNLAPDTVARLQGNISAWSAVWSNTVTVIITNNYSFTTNVTDGTNIVATVLITNPNGTTNGQTMTVNGADVRTWSTNVTNPATQIETAGTIGQAAANLFDQVSAFPITGLTVAPSGTNGITLQTAANGNLDVVLSPGWGTVTYATNDAFTNIVAELAPITNVVTVGFQTLMLDATGLTTVQAVTVQELVTHSANLVVDDNISIGTSASIDAQRLTLNGNFSLPAGNATENWSRTIAPNVSFFTNAGYLFVYNEGHFGDDGPNPYSAFVNTNTGTIDTSVLHVKSDYFQNNGTLLAIDSMLLQFTTGKLENGFSSSGGNTEFSASTLKLSNYNLVAGGALNFDVASALFDAGAGSGNVFTTDHGFNLLVKPQTGDLLGTTFQTQAPDFSYPQHSWAGEDRGSSVAGFSNNVALGQLVLRPDGLDPFFTFSGTGIGNGLYVDYLDLSQLTDYANQLELAPNITIYYAAANLNFTPPGGLTPEEYLDQQFGGHLQWVSSYAGPNSSVDVVINGNQTIKVNKALRNSKVIDSDADGVPNFYDLSPFDGVITTLQVQQSPPGFKISWLAAPKTLYRVEYRAGTSGPWTVLTEAINPSTSPVPWSVVDTNISSGSQRYYRVSYNPNGP